jgi:hypothetical protein
MVSGPYEDPELKRELLEALGSLPKLMADIAKSAWGIDTYKLSINEVAALFKTDAKEVRRVLTEVRWILERKELIHALPRH